MDLLQTMTTDMAESHSSARERFSSRYGTRALSSLRNNPCRRLQAKADPMRKRRYLGYQAAGTGTLF